MSRSLRGGRETEQRFNPSVCPDCGTSLYTKAAERGHNCHSDQRRYDPEFIEQAIIPAVVAYHERTGHDHVWPARLQRFLPDGKPNRTVGRYLAACCREGLGEPFGVELSVWSDGTPTTYVIEATP